MGLPKIDVPTYDFTIPSTGDVIKVRPFNVKEEKLLLLAVEDGKLDNIISTVKQVINNCIVSGEIDFDKVPYFDIDYLFIFLRGKSIGETQEIRLTCNNKVKDIVCGQVFPAQLDIGKVEIVGNKQRTGEIKLDETRKVKMKYPNYSVLKQIDQAADIDKKTMLIVNSIEQIVAGKETFAAKDFTKKELKDFIESLTEEMYKKLEEWVDSAPGFLAIIDATCPKCGFEHHVRYADFYDFFT